MSILLALILIVALIVAAGLVRCQHRAESRSRGAAVRQP